MKIWITLIITALLLAVAMPLPASAQDTTPPTVVSTDPPDNNNDMDVDHSISAVFSEEMDPDSIDDYSFIVENLYCKNNNPASDCQVRGEVTYSSGSRTARFTPNSLLEHDTKYSARITSKARDLADNHLAGDYTWTFITRTIFGGGGTGGGCFLAAGSE